MARSLRHILRPLTWALMLTFAAVVSTECLMAAEMTEAQKACCVAMKHDCDSAAVQQDCCASESLDVVGLVSATPAKLLVALPIVATILTSTEPALTATVRDSAAFDSGAPKSSRRPPYLFFSVFRI